VTAARLAAQGAERAPGPTLAAQAKKLGQRGWKPSARRVAGLSHRRPSGPPVPVKRHAPPAAATSAARVIGWPPRRLGAALVDAVRSPLGVVEAGHPHRDPARRAHHLLRREHPRRVVVRGQRRVLHARAAALLGVDRGARHLHQTPAAGPELDRPAALPQVVVGRRQRHREQHARGPRRRRVGAEPRLQPAAGEGRVALGSRGLDHHAAPGPPGGGRHPAAQRTGADDQEIDGWLLEVCHGVAARAAAIMARPRPPVHPARVGRRGCGPIPSPVPSFWIVGFPTWRTAPTVVRTGQVEITSGNQ
jgi:hypothetical protein